ncbi:MAG: glycerophosphodiester phosphodiesterase [Terriglobales bacterium]
MRARPLLLGHRGARRHAPENTLEAFDLSLRHGCDGFEFDVRLCADGHDVICHDPKIGRHEVARSSFDQLGAPCLEDVLAGYASRAVLDIELKVEGLEPVVVELVRRYPPRRGYFISSFLPTVAEALYRIDRSLPLGLICDSASQLAAWKGVPVRAMFLERRLCSAAAVAALHGAGKQVFVWTINREREMLDFAELGVDGIISDDTDLLAKTFPSGSDSPGGRPHQER